MRRIFAVVTVIINAVAMFRVLEIAIVLLKENLMDVSFAGNPLALLIEPVVKLIITVIALAFCSIHIVTIGICIKIMKKNVLKTWHIVMIVISYLFSICSIYTYKFPSIV